MEEDSNSLAVSGDIIICSCGVVHTNYKDYLRYREADAEVDVDEVTHVDQGPPQCPEGGRGGRGGEGKGGEGRGGGGGGVRGGEGRGGGGGGGVRGGEGRGGEERKGGRI